MQAYISHPPPYNVNSPRPKVCSRNGGDARCILHRASTKSMPCMRERRRYCETRRDVKDTSIRVYAAAKPIAVGSSRGARSSRVAGLFARMPPQSL